ncbi:hypothetical protein [Nocardioides lacus]|uniref:hypothetical protein n=1 Tax=Nocardioides sp. BP30 TaxID=3036374 RepID=UPI00406C0421
MPSADDLFRPTRPGAEDESAQPVRAVPDAGQTQPADAGAETSEQGPKRPSGRVRHDEKMTVYVTAEELLELEHARLTLRSKHGVALDRGRLVREAVAIVLADLESNGEQSALVRRLAEG